MENQNSAILPAQKIIKHSDILRSLRQVSLVFFFVIGAAHLLSGLFASQNIFLPFTNIVNRALDIPFAIIGTVLGLSQAKISSESSFKTTYLVLMTLICLLVLGVLLYINLLIPDKIIS